MNKKDLTTCPKCGMVRHKNDDHCYGCEPTPEEKQEAQEAQETAAEEHSKRFLWLYNRSVN